MSLPAPSSDGAYITFSERSPRTPAGFHPAPIALGHSEGCSLKATAEFVCRDRYPITFRVCFKYVGDFSYYFSRATLEAIQHTEPTPNSATLVAYGCIVGLDPVPGAKSATKIVSGSPTVGLLGR